ncbi:MAG TPA: molybdopterin biosynthesis protein [Thermoleophilaceae bacterium]|nr:molybdopterin biosynthesis protein [Thermoleophilaceae bacterium]
MARAVPYIHDRPAAEAFAAWGEACAAAGCPERLESIRLPLDQAVGRVTAEPVWARASSPPFDAAAMDGIAVHASDTVGASETTPARLDAAAFEIVDTGDPIPGDFDAVVMREDVQELTGGVELRAAAAPFQHVRSIGEDVSAGELLLPAGHRLRPVDVAAAGAAGATELVVRRRPIVTVIPTGDEIRPVGAQLGKGELPDTNSVMLAAQAEAAGCQAHRFEVTPDVPDEIAAAVRAAAARSDLVIVIAGSSAGRDDHTAEVVEKVGTLVVHGVAVRPGHPVVLGVVGAEPAPGAGEAAAAGPAGDGRRPTPVLGAPGYPVSAALTFDIFAAPLLAELEGAPPPEGPVARARLARKLASTMGMDDWVRVRLGSVRGRLVATPLPRGAGVLTSLVRADGLLVVPSELEGHHAGEEVTVQLLRGVGEIERTIVVTGSHDLVLDLAASTLRERDARVTLASSNVGSLGGLTALRDGLCHVAGSHLLDPDTGEYTLPYLGRLLPDRGLAVVRLVHREQGLIVATGNPTEATGIEDVARHGLRYVNRQRGAGTRVLLDHELARQGVSPEAIQGYEREEHTHLAVAAAVAAGRADCGLGVLAAARAFGLDFVPVAKEPYDLVLLMDSIEDELLAPLFELLESPAFRDAVKGLGGYDTAEMGRRIL